MQKATLILFPNLLGKDSDFSDFFPDLVKKRIKHIDGLYCESEKEGRRYLLRFLSKSKANSIPLRILSEHTRDEEFEDLILPLLEGKTYGIISDAGLPCLADPGHRLVSLAHKYDIFLEAISGPSSIFLALILSGFSGQRFTFHGYLERKEKELIRQIKTIENRSENFTQIFIEAPYRNNKLYQFLLKHLRKDTYLCLAQNLGTYKDMVVTSKIEKFRQKKLKLSKDPMVFLLYRDKKFSNTIV